MLLVLLFLNWIPALAHLNRTWRARLVVIRSCPWFTDATVTFVIDVQEVEAEVVHAFVKVVAGRSKKTHQVIYHFSVLCTSMKQKQCLESIHTSNLSIINQIGTVFFKERNYADGLSPLTPTCKKKKTTYQVETNL
jgi:hypothetical protein